MQLVVPSITYQESFLSAVDEYQKEQKSSMHMRNEHYNLLNKGELVHNFQAYVDLVKSRSTGRNLPPGYVPESTFWYVDNNTYIGRVSIRHTLTKPLLETGGHIGYDIRPSQRGKGYGNKLLSLALEKAKDLGITKVLITCNVNNIPSKKVIEANKGIFENRVKTQEGESDKLRYWITLENQP